jgi:uracil-DNA glycosylase
MLYFNSPRSAAQYSRQAAGRPSWPAAAERDSRFDAAFSHVQAGCLLMDVETEARSTSTTMQAQLDIDAEQIAGDLQHCRRCDLWKHASQAVSGEGAAHARIMLVGEQPGDAEDLRGHPFVGPAGRILSRVKPLVLVALGAAALRALLGRTLTIDAARRQSLRHSSGAAVLASYHPSAILRAKGEQAVHLAVSLIRSNRALVPQMES